MSDSYTITGDALDSLYQLQGALKLVTSILQDQAAFEPHISISAEQLSLFLSLIQRDITGVIRQTDI